MRVEEMQLAKSGDHLSAGDVRRRREALEQALMPTWGHLGELREAIREFSRPPEPVRVLRGLCEDYCFAKDAYAFLASVSSPAERPHDDAHLRKYEALWQDTRLNFQRMTGEDIAKTIDTAEAKKSRWRMFGNYKSGKQRTELRWRVVKYLEDSLVEHHRDKMVRAGMRPGTRDEILAHAYLSRQVGHLAPAPELLATSTAGGKQ